MLLQHLATTDLTMPYILIQRYLFIKGSCPNNTGYEVVECQSDNNDEHNTYSNVLEVDIYNQQSMLKMKNASRYALNDNSDS